MNATRTLHTCLALGCAALVSLGPSLAEAAPPAGDVTSGIRFASPVNGAEVALSEGAALISKFVYHLTANEEGKIYSCVDYDAACGEGNNCSYEGHRGTDIRVNQDYADSPTPIYAAARGWVSSREDGHPNTPDASAGYGNHVFLDHGCGVQTIYGHMKSNGVAAEGVELLCGQRVGWGAESGYVFGDVGYREHTHFEVRVNDVFIDPFAGECNLTTGTNLWAGQGFGSYQCQAAHPPGCLTVPPPVDGSTFVEESAPFDGEVLGVGQAFQKSWTIQNVGNQDWIAANYRLVYSQDADHYEGVSPNQMGGPGVIEFPQDVVVPPGGVFNYTLDLVAPNSPGHYRAAWVVDNKNFGPFGDGYWVDINVVADPNGGGGSAACETSDYGEVSHASCWQVDYPQLCSWQRCDNGQTQAVADPTSECLGERLYKDSCQLTGDDAAWMADLLVQDDAQILPGTLFEKRWRVQNTGDSVWDASVDAAHAAGFDQPGYAPTQADGPTSVALEQVVGPGGYYDLSVVLRAPQTPGKYVAAWHLRRDGQPFGGYFWVLFEVVTPPGDWGCEVGYSELGTTVWPGTCVQSDRRLPYQEPTACAWQQCNGDGNWVQGPVTDLSCAAAGGYVFPSCVDGDGESSGWTGWCPGPHCPGGDGGGGDPVPDPDPEPEPGDPPCPCSADPGLDNFCLYGLNNPTCPPTQPGGYCDPNGDGSFMDADWDLGWYEYAYYCG